MYSNKLKSINRWLNLHQNGRIESFHNIFSCSLLKKIFVSPFVFLVFRFSCIQLQFLISLFSFLSPFHFKILFILCCRYVSQQTFLFARYLAIQALSIYGMLMSGGPHRPVWFLSRVPVSFLLWSFARGRVLKPRLTMHYGSAEDAFPADTVYPLRATTEFLVAWRFAAANLSRCVTHRSPSLGAFPSCYELCKPTSQFGPSPVASPSAASSPAYSAVSLDSADPEDYTGIS